MAMVEVSGNLGKTPELRYTADGHPWVCLSIAENHRFRGKTWTDWWDGVIFGSLALQAAEALEQGANVSVKGRLAVKAEEYEGQQVLRRTVHVELLGYHGAKAKADTENTEAQKTDTENEESE